jgi:hypothetical protein
MQHTLARLLSIFILVACAPLLGGCGEDASAKPPDMNRQLPPNVFFGKWKLTQASLAMLVRDGFVVTADAAPAAGRLPASLTEGLPPSVAAGLAPAVPPGMAPEPVYTIDFTPDGWVKFESVLDDVRGGTFVKCLGTWQVRHDAVVENEPRANVVEVQLLRANSRYFLKLLVTEDDGDIRLWNTYGDAKLRERIVYERPDVKKRLGW